MKRHAALGLALIVLTIVLQAGAVRAQSSPSAPAIAAPSMSAGVDARVTRRVDEMHDRLKITPAQQPQWDAFAAVMRQNTAHMEAVYKDRAAHMASMNALDDMRSYAQVAQAHADDVNKLLPAFDALYSAMSPDQKVGADKIFRQFQTREEDRRHGTHM